MKLRPLNERDVDRKDYLYQPRLFRRGYPAAGKRTGHAGVTFVAGLVTGVILVLLSLLLYPQAVMAFLRMVVQVIHTVGDKP